MSSPSSLSVPPGAVPREGETIAGKYRVERVLGAGGMGIVLLATHEQLEEKVAIKILGRALVESPVAVSRFVREARAAVRIRSEHVVRVLDVGTLDDGVPFLVMEHLAGQDLREVLRARGSLPVTEAVGYVLQACDGLASAHALGVVHRDLKPGNLFLVDGQDGAPLIKVLDFGISKVMDGAEQLTATAELIGSPPYMSPEHIENARGVDQRTDVWSLGIILHELVAGTRPFTGSSALTVPLSIVTADPIRLREARADAPEGLEAVILRCLEKRADDRFPDVGALALALAPFGPAGSVALAERAARIVGRPAAAPTPTPTPVPAPARTDPAREPGPSFALPQRTVTAIAEERSGTVPGGVQSEVARPPSRPGVLAVLAGLSVLGVIAALGVRFTRSEAAPAAPEPAGPPSAVAPREAPREAPARQPEVSPVVAAGAEPAASASASSSSGARALPPSAPGRPGAKRPKPGEREPVVPPAAPVPAPQAAPAGAATIDSRL